MAIAGPGQLNTRESPTCGSRSVHCFENLDKIGEGTYGQVYKAREIKTGEIVALKKIRMDNEREGFPITAIREIKLLKKLHHENVINLKEIVTSPPDGGVYMVFNYMDHDLAGLAKRPGMKFSVPQIKCYMRQLLTGLHYCHVNRVLHRDIKGANLLIDNEGNLKLADFGLSRSFSNDQNRNLTNNVITYWYRPPELLLGTTKYGPAVDMWSVGCVFAELLHGKPILPGKDEPEQASRIWELCGAPDENIWPGVTKLPWYNNLKPRRPLKRRLQEVFKHFDPHALELLEKMLTLDPDKRISAKDALDAEYFWIDPLPCDPKSLPKYEASHEFQTNKKRQQQRQHDEVAKRQKIQHQQQQHSCIPPPMQPQQQQQQHSRIPPPMQQQQHSRIPPPMQQQQHSRIPPPMQQQSRQAHTQMRPGLPNAPMHGSQPPLVAGGGGPGHHYGKSLGGPSGGSNRYPQGGNPSGGGYNHHPNRGSGPYPPSQAYGRSTGGNSSYAGGPPNYLQGSRSYNGAGRPGGGRDNARGQQYNNGH